MPVSSKKSKAIGLQFLTKNFGSRNASFVEERKAIGLPFLTKIFG